MGQLQYGINAMKSFGFEIMQRKISNQNQRTNDSRDNYDTTQHNEEFHDASSNTKSYNLATVQHQCHHKQIRQAQIKHATLSFTCHNQVGRKRPVLQKLLFQQAQQIPDKITA